MLTYRQHGEKVRIIMMATREQERKALEKIRAIVEGLGENSYIGTAFEGCFEIAERNIEYDFADSMKNKFEMAATEADTLRQKVKTLSSDTNNLKKQISRLEEQLEKELEWQPYDDKDNVSQSEYDKLINDIETRFLSDDEAKDILYDWFGFAKEKVKIINSVDKYEINRHKQLRKAGTVDRRPAYNATDWNYIRFNCGCLAYELCNDEIRLFVG